MRQWVALDVDFGMPMVRLTFPFRRADDAGTAFLRDIQKMTPDEIEIAAKALIHRCRPELDGGSVVAMSYDQSRIRLEFLYIHPSLPKTGCGEIAAEMPLIPEPSEVKPDVVTG